MSASTTEDELMLPEWVKRFIAENPVETTAERRSYEEMSRTIQRDYADDRCRLVGHAVYWFVDEKNTVGFLAPLYPSSRKFLLHAFVEAIRERHVEARVNRYYMTVKLELLNGKPNWSDACLGGVR